MWPDKTVQHTVQRATKSPPTLESHAESESACRGFESLLRHPSSGIPTCPWLWEIEGAGRARGVRRIATLISPENRPVEAQFLAGNSGVQFSEGRDLHCSSRFGQFPRNPRTTLDRRKTRSLADETVQRTFQRGGRMRRALNTRPTRRLSLPEPRRRDLASGESQDATRRGGAGHVSVIPQVRCRTRGRSQP